MSSKRIQTAFFILICRGGACGRGGRCGAKVRFFKEKAPQKPFWERFLGYPMGWVRTWRFPRLRGRAQYLPRAKTGLHGAFPYGAHLSLGGMIAKCLGCFQIGIYRGVMSVCEETKISHIVGRGVTPAENKGQYLAKRREQAPALRFGGIFFGVLCLSVKNRILCNR